MTKIAKDDPRIKTVTVPKSRLNPEPSNPVDWGRYALMGGGGLLGYSLAKQLLDDDEETKKKRSLLSKLFCAIAPFGAAYLGAKGLDMLANKIGPTKTSGQNGEGDKVEAKQIRLSDGKNYLFKSSEARMTDTELANLANSVVRNNAPGEPLTTDAIRRDEDNTYVWPYGVGAGIGVGGAFGLGYGAWSDFGKGKDVFSAQNMPGRFSRPNHGLVDLADTKYFSALNANLKPKEIANVRESLNGYTKRFDDATRYHKKGVMKGIGAAASIAAAVASGWKAFENAKKIKDYQELAERFAGQYHD